MMGLKKGGVMNANGCYDKGVFLGVGVKSGDADVVEK
jgi:hypothetical protein